MVATEVIEIVTTVTFLPLRGFQAIFCLGMATVRERLARDRFDLTCQVYPCRGIAFVGQIQPKLTGAEQINGALYAISR